MSQLLYTLALLACPVGMGAMMWMMNRKPKAAPDETAAKQAELAGLRAEVDRLHGERVGAAGDTRPAL